MSNILCAFKFTRVDAHLNFMAMYVLRTAQDTVSLARKNYLRSNGMMRRINIDFIHCAFGAQSDSAIAQGVHVYFVQSLPSYCPCVAFLHLTKFVFSKYKIYKSSFGITIIIVLILNFVCKIDTQNGQFPIAFAWCTVFTSIAFYHLLFQIKLKLLENFAHRHRQCWCRCILAEMTVKEHISTINAMHARIKNTISHTHTIIFHPKDIFPSERQ